MSTAQKTIEHPGMTRLLADYAFETRYDDLPESTVEMAKRCMLDGTAVMLAGSVEPCARIVRSFAMEAGNAGRARTVGADSVRLSVQHAALANGIAGHALDWDDTALSEEKDRSVLIHPTIQPLAVGYALADVVEMTPRDLLAAMVVAMEVQIKMCEAISAEHYTGGRGFHSSGTIGSFGATVAAGRLLGLTRDQMQQAFGLAATMTSGIGANHGTMAKPLNMGLAAENGIKAASLARLGMDGKTNALEVSRGFFDAYGGGYDPGKIVGRLGNPYAILDPGISVKPYPSGVVGHPGMDAMKRLVIEHDLKPEQVQKITVRCGGNVVEPGPLRIPHANTELEAKFCVPFQMAAMVLRRKAGLAEFNDAFVQSEACQAMQKKVEPVLDPDIDALGKDTIRFVIEVETTDGRTLTGESEPHYRGGPKNPLSWEELTEKFLDCAPVAIDASKARVFVERLSDVERADSVGPILDSLCAPA